MTFPRWIESSGAPAALALRMRQAIVAVDQGSALSVEEGAVNAALTLMDTVLSDDSGSRAGAITLLAADALMTYAFEAGAASPGRIDALAADAMQRIAAAAGQ
jgi:hypothetical protein